MKLLILCALCFIGLISAATVKNATQPLRGSKESKIYGGTRAKDGEIPWIVAIRNYEFNSGTFSCSGVILTENQILTAASCVYEYLQYPSHYAVYAGSVISSGHGGTKHQVVSITPHENYVMENQENDIAIVEVFPPMEFTKRSYPIALPMQGAELADDFRVAIAGFGNDPSTNTDPSYYGTPLKKSYLTTVEHTLCRSLYDETNQNFITDDTLCAGLPNRVCQWDNGGPLYFNGVLYGIIKMQVSTCEINALTPGLFTKVSNFVDWIKEKTGLYPQ